MRIRATFSWVLQAIFVCALIVAYSGIVAGSLGYLSPASASLVAFTGSAVACFAGLAVVLVSQRELTRTVQH